jgi:hypothetical protein
VRQPMPTVPKPRPILPQPQVQAQPAQEGTRPKTVPMVIRPQPDIQAQSASQQRFSQPAPTRQIPAASKQTNSQLVHSVISPNGAYTAATVRDGAELRLYVQKGDSSTLVGVYNTIDGVTWSSDSKTVRFRATKAVAPEKVEEREATYQPAKQVLKWRVTRVIRI